tara:strand:+ start:564 stop:668 length:105 start_codon:yes stop_codon:yes gene_type:complete
MRIDEIMKAGSLEKVMKILYPKKPRTKKPNKGKK